MPPSCSGGDPQICAVLVQQWNTQCAIVGSTEPPAEPAGQDPAQLFETLDDAAANLDSAGFNAPRQCPVPSSFPFGSSSISIDVEGVCEGLNFIGALVLVLAYLTAARILTRSN